MYFHFEKKNKTKQKTKKTKKTYVIQKMLTLTRVNVTFHLVLAFSSNCIHFL